MLGIGLGLQKRSGNTDIAFPDQISNLQVRFESDMGITITSGRVSAWADQSSNANHAVQNTAINRPILVNDVLNGLPVLRFNRANLEFLQTINNINISGAQARTVFLISKHEVNASYEMWPLGFGGLTHYKLNGVVFKDTTHYGVGYYNSRIGVANVLTDWQLNCFIHPTGATLTTALQIFRNGQSVATTELTGVAGTVNTDNSTLRIGRTDLVNAGNVYSGDIAAILVYSKALSTQERQSVEQYLSNKYDIALS